VGAFDDRQRGAKAAAVLCLVGVVNIPIIKFSVDWWNTLHQPASVNPMGESGIAIDSAMLIPLFTMAIAFKAYYVTTMLLGMRREIAAAKVRSLRMAAVDG
jgi:heme exporter protein C